jgi:hypothetical protein
MGNGGKVTVSAGTAIPPPEEPPKLKAANRFSLMVGQKAAMRPLKIKRAKIPSHTFQDSVRLKIYSPFFPAGKWR